MEPKESKSNWHFTISLVKSFLRIAAGVALVLGSISNAGILLMVAEVGGILEEL